jgi:c-di-GMP-related signal transduction protein
LFSCIDAFFDRPLAEIVTKLPLAIDVKEALLGKENDLSNILATILTYEKGEWDRFNDLSAMLRLDKEKAIELYLEAVSWANKIKADTVTH